MSSDSRQKLTPYIGPAGTWALALGTSIGWGSLIVTSNTYLVKAGPAGSIFGILAGAVVMLLIGYNYYYMTECFPDAGGVYACSKETFGYDHGFLVSWFLTLPYGAMLWANASSLPLFARYFMGEIFQFGKLYTLFGYDIYFGELLLTFLAILLIAFLSIRRKRFTMTLMTGLVLFFAIGILICFLVVAAGHGGSSFSYKPEFLPDKSALSQIIRIASISPWAFIGFENVSHAAEEFTYKRTRLYRIIAAAVLTAALLYVFLLVISVSAYPPEYASWFDYIKDHGNLEGLKGLPVFYAVHYYFGDGGVMLMIGVLLALILTSLIGNTYALGRLFYALARDEILPLSFARLNEDGVPDKAVWLIVAISIPVMFVGRTAIGWIVDVTTLGATLIYGLVSASTVKIARLRGDRREQWIGIAGLILMIGFAVCLLAPNFFSTGSMARETYFLFVIWGILGFLFFRNILDRDSHGRFGKSLIVWIALLSLLLLVALVWMSQSMMSSTNETMTRIHDHYIEEGDASQERLEDELFMEEQMSSLNRSNRKTMMVVTGLFGFSLIILFTNYSYMNKKAKENEEALGHARNLANTDPLTGIKSRHAWLVREGEINEQIREGQAEPFAVCVCDVNGLKYINDIYGHKAGDELIRSASRMICRLFQHSPVFRIGGDEFVVIMTGQDYENRKDLMERLHSQSEENIKTKNVVVAGGCCDYSPGMDEDLHAVFEKADQRMYRKKKELKERGAVSRD